MTFRPEPDIYPTDEDLPEEEAMVSLPASTVALVADLLTDLDEFLRSGTGASELLAVHLAIRASIASDDPCPSLPFELGKARGDVCFLIDQLSFTAHELRDHYTGGVIR